MLRVLSTATCQVRLFTWGVKVCNIRGCNRYGGWSLPTSPSLWKTVKHPVKHHNRKWQRGNLETNNFMSCFNDSCYTSIDGEKGNYFFPPKERPFRRTDVLSCYLTWQWQIFGIQIILWHVTPAIKYTVIILAIIKIPLLSSFFTLNYRFEQI